VDSYRQKPIATHEATKHFIAHLSPPIFRSRSSVLLYEEIDVHGWTKVPSHVHQSRTEEDTVNYAVPAPHRKAVNLWWGERLSESGKIGTLGYVIGLRNLDAGIAWRLDYDEKKGAHINQLTRLAGRKRWNNLVHPITFPGDPGYFVKWFWRRFTEGNARTIPAHILERVKQLDPSHKVLHWL
jgi:hypothetical protein